MYFDLLGCSSPRSEGEITWSACEAESPLFDSDRLAPSGSAPPVSPNSGEPGMVIARSPNFRQWQADHGQPASSVLKIRQGRCPIQHSNLPAAFFCERHSDQAAQPFSPYVLLPPNPGDRLCRQESKVENSHPWTPVRSDSRAPFSA